MIEISINFDKNTQALTPLISFNKDINLNEQSAAVILFFLESGVYSKLLFDKISQQLDEETINKIEMYLQILRDAETEVSNQQFEEDELEFAKEPIIKPEDMLLS